jgi:hypothetical protein
VERLCAFTSTPNLETLWLGNPLAGFLVNLATAIWVEITPVLVAKQVPVLHHVFVLDFAVDEAFNWGALGLPLAIDISPDAASTFAWPFVI